MKQYITAVLSQMDTGLKDWNCEKLGQKHCMNVERLNLEIVDHLGQKYLNYTQFCGLHHVHYLFKKTRQDACMTLIVVFIYMFKNEYYVRIL